MQLNMTHELFFHCLKRYYMFSSKESRREGYTGFSESAK